MIACYIRVSTTSQNSDGQKKEIKRWLKGQGHVAKDVTWFEDQETGKHTDRPAFQKMQQAVFMGELKNNRCLAARSPFPQPTRRHQHACGLVRKRRPRSKRDAATRFERCNGPFNCRCPIRRR